MGIDKYLNGIDKAILDKTDIRDVAWNPLGFTYYWFLICFFHDFVYSILGNLKNEKVRMFNEIKCDKIKEKIGETFKSMPFNDGIVPKVLKNLCSSYLDYRFIHSDEKFDHGILAGSYFFYDREEQLKNNIKNAANEKRFKKYNENEVYDCEKNLVWSKYILENIHADVSWLIATHNMWFIKNTDKNLYIYQKNNLDNLVTDHPIFSLTDHPFYFLLVFVDMLDIFKFLRLNTRKRGGQSSIKIFLMKS